jgi:hypothetical protein
MNDTTEPAPLNQREMNQFIALATLPTLERALARLRWLEAEVVSLKAGREVPTSITRCMVRLDGVWITPDAALDEIHRLRAEVDALKAKHGPQTDAQVQEQVAAIVHAAMRFAREDVTPEWQAGNSHAEYRARQAATEIASMLRCAVKPQADPLNDAVEEACGELPEGWMVLISLERGAGWVDLIYPCGRMHQVHEDETKVADLVREAIRRAKEAKPA